MSNDVKDQDATAEESAVVESAETTEESSETAEVSSTNEEVSEPKEDHSEPNVDAVAEDSSEAPKAVAKSSHKEAAPSVQEPKSTGPVAGVAAFFDHPEHLMYAATQARDAKFERFDALSPFPIHGMDEAMGLGRSWIPWVTFGAGAAGLATAASLQFGIMAFDWPMVFGGRPFIAWPSFVPIMFELTVLFAGVTTPLVMLIAAGCFRKPLIIDRQITNNRFALWIAADDKKFDRDQVVEFMKSLNPTEIRTVNKDGK